MTEQSRRLAVISYQKKMKKIILIITFFLIANSNLFGQENCNCNADFQFVVEKIEKEHPGYSLNVNKNNAEIYNELKTSIKAEISKVGITKDLCQENLRKYLNFIKDKHLKIYDPIAIGESEYEKNFVSKNVPELKSLNDSTLYLKIPSFNYKLWKELDHFYDSITPIIKSKKKVIVDIRNNGGGGERMYSQLLKILKSNSNKIKIGVVFNRKCASACEEVALIVTENKNIKTFGENTNGQFAYGFVKGYKTPNCGFTFVTTTKKYPERIKYEYIGVTPEIILDKENESEWINIVDRKLDD
jgi:hypothetical protein